MRLILLALMFFMVSCSQKIIMTPNVDKLTDNISNNSQTEIVVCLKYVEVFSVIYIYDYYIPVIIESTSISATAQRCPRSYGILWHNHPIMGFEAGLAEFMLDRFDITLEDPVFLSKTDIATAENYNYVIVSSKNKWAWWGRNQLDDEAIIQKPIEDQVYER